MDQTIVQAVLGHAEAHPQKLAVCFKDQKLTYAQLAERVRTFAFFLWEREQVKPGDIVMINALSKPEYVVAWLAVQYLGATVVPVDKSALEENLISLYHFVEPKFILTDGRIRDESVKKISLREWYRETEQKTEFIPYQLPDMDSTAEINFTTGTTGTPKGAMLSYGNILTSTLYTRDGVHRKPEDIELLSLPLNHSFGMRELRTVLYVGGTAVLQNGFTFIKELEENLRNYHCTGMAIVPAAMEKLYRSLGERFKEIFGMFKHLEVGAGSLSVEMKQNLLSVIPQVNLYNVWGSTETTGGVIFLDVTHHPEHIGSIGVPAKGAEIYMLDEDGKVKDAVSAETAGRMAMRGSMQMQGYYKQEELTARTIVDGLLYTNDLAYRTEDGYIYMLSRLDDIINVGGEKVSPVEVENTAETFEQVRECACVGVADPEGIFGQIPVLFVVPQGVEFDQKRALEFLSKRLEQYKLPKKFVTVDALPRNRMQKIDRRKLKEMWENGQSGVEQNAVVSAIYGRRSIRDFLDQRIPRELLEQVVACGYQAPSGHNMQTWKFTVIRDREEIKRLKEVALAVAKRNKAFSYGFNWPDALILISNDRRNPNGIQDSSCAAQNIMLAAHSYGLGSVWINVLRTISDEPEIREILTSYGIPETHNVWATIALGYPANQPSALAKKENVVQWVE